MKFFKDNSYNIVRLYINQIGITIFSMILYTSVSAMEDVHMSRIIKTCISIFAILFYYALVYNVAWEYGAKDRIRVDSGRYSDSKYKGLCMGLCANSLNYIFAIVCIILVSLYMIFDAEALMSAFSIIYMIMKLHASMFIGLLQAIMPSPVTDVLDGGYYLVESIVFLVFPLISAVITHFSYRIGFNEKKIFTPKK